MRRILLWFRSDLRLADNPALTAILEEGAVPIPVYIDDDQAGAWPMGAASAWWLHHSLMALKKSLRALGSDLLLLRGDSEQCIGQLLADQEIAGVYWNRCYEPAAIMRDRGIKETLQEQGVECRSFSAGLLIEPWQHLKKDDTPYRVFTPFWKALFSAYTPGPLLEMPAQLPALPKTILKTSLDIDSLSLLPQVPWDVGMKKSWQPGEQGARVQLENFLEEGLIDYPKHRDIPSLPGSSRLSPYLHFGEIGPRQVWHRCHEYMDENKEAGIIKAGEAFLRELGWREFSLHLLYHFPDTPDQPLNERFSHFPWRKHYEEDLKLWQQGKTGIPIVDAGMRELWTTGWMHNRVRMIVASLLTKNMLIPWQEGARWFWDTLVDADLANNTQGWQWTAGCGADAAPYFRIFNPVLQGERFDPEGHYVRQWVPALRLLPRKWMHRPWEAPQDVLAEAGIRLGEEYPEPVVDLAATRLRALDSWDRIKRL